jgi:hypothetical protein
MQASFRYERYQPFNKRGGNGRDVDASGVEHLLHILERRQADCR